MVPPNFLAVTEESNSRLKRTSFSERLEYSSVVQTVDLPSVDGLGGSFFGGLLKNQVGGCLSS